MTVEQIKALIDTPLFLFVVMILASVVSGLQQVSSARRAGKEVSCLEYLKHWPETIGVLGANVLAFIIAIATDQLNLMAAIGIGFGLNTLMDSLRAGGRTTLLSEGKK